MTRQEMVVAAAALRGRIVELRAGGMKREIIAERLGITLGAVAGHLFRAQQEANGIPRPPAVTRAISGHQPGTPNGPPRAKKPQPKPEIAAAPPESKPPPVRVHRCCWPTWTNKDEAYWAVIARGEAFECGVPVRAGQLYCEQHKKAATTTFVRQHPPGSAASPSMTPR